MRPPDLEFVEKLTILMGLPLCETWCFSGAAVNTQLFSSGFSALVTADREGGFVMGSMHAECLLYLGWHLFP